MIKKAAKCVSSGSLLLFLWTACLMVICPLESLASDDNPPVDRGRTTFEQKCSPCHTLGRGNGVGPDLFGVTERRDKSWLMVWISDPSWMVQSEDPIAMALIKEYPGIRMPSLGLSQEEISSVLTYLESQGALKQLPVSGQVREEEAGPKLGFMSKTYLRFFEDTQGNRYSPVYEHLAFEIRDKKVGFFSSGWVVYNLGAARAGRRETDELNYGYLRYAPYSDSTLLFNIGRHYVFEGVASEQIDGFSSRWEITPRTGLSIFGGIPVENGSDDRGGDFIYGTRLFQRIDKMAEAGISFLREDNNASGAREEFGMDIWLLPIKGVDFYGHSFLNTSTGGWMEHSYGLRFSPSQRLAFSGLFLHSNYTDAFAARTLSVFSPDYLGKDEELTKIGGSVAYRPARGVSIVGDLSGYDYRTSGNARYYGMLLAIEFSKITAGASLHRMEGASTRLRYVESRAYLKKNYRKVILSLDAINMRYDVPFNSLSNAYTVSGTMVYKINRSWSAGADLYYSRTPDFTHNTVALLKISYNLAKEL